MGGGLSQADGPGLAQPPTSWLLPPIIHWTEPYRARWWLFMLRFVGGKLRIVFYKYIYISI